MPELQALLLALGFASDQVQRILVSMDAPRAAKAAVLKQKSSHTFREEVSLSVPTGGGLLRALRLRSGLNIVQIAHAVGVNVSSVSRWEGSSARPSPKIMEQLFVLLRPTEEERECLIESGVAKIKVDRPAYDYQRLNDSLLQLESQVLKGDSNNLELRIMQIESLLWWEGEEHGEAVHLLAKAHAIHSEALFSWKRVGDAARHAEAALALLDGAQEYDSINVLAMIMLARCEVYSSTPSQPHVGLLMLTKLKEGGVSARDKALLLAEMAIYAMGIEDQERGSRYAREAIELSRPYRDPRISVLTKHMRCFLIEHEANMGSARRLSAG